MNEKINELMKLCDYYHLDLIVKFYGGSTNFIGINDDDQEIFNVCVWQQKDRRTFYLELNSDKEQWTGGQFRKEDILLFLSFDELTNEELNIKGAE
jgi:hypothetical protein